MLKVEDNKITPRKAKEIFFLDFSPEMINDPNLILEMRKNISNNYGYIIRNVINADLIDRIIKYLESIARNSLPSYYPLKEGCLDFHRINQLDERSYVKACMHQFMFHPWNQNVFNLFSEMEKIYHLKNLVSGLDKESFLNNTPKDGYIARLSFQHYPKGGGMLKKHSDPIGEHQLSVPLLMMSDKSQDFKAGGGYAVTEKDEIIDLDSLMNKGDLLFFNAEVMHGVQVIDPEDELDWLSFRGRWIMIASTIKTLANTSTPNSIQLED